MKIEVAKKINEVLYKVWNERVQKYTIEEININYTHRCLTVYYICKDMKGDVKVIYENDLCDYGETPYEAVLKHTESLVKKAGRRLE